MRILIAEDEVTIARVLKVMLEKNKYAVDMVHNGSDALDYIQMQSIRQLHGRPACTDPHQRRQRKGQRHADFLLSAGQV